MWSGSCAGLEYQQTIKPFHGFFSPIHEYETVWNITDSTSLTLWLTDGYTLVQWGQVHGQYRYIYCWHFLQLQSAVQWVSFLNFVLHQFITTDILWQEGWHTCCTINAVVCVWETLRREGHGSINFGVLVKWRGSSVSQSNITAKRSFCSCHCRWVILLWVQIRK